MTFSFVAGMITAIVGIAFAASSVKAIRAGYEPFEEVLTFLGGLVVVTIGSCMMLPLVVTTFDL